MQIDDSADYRKTAHDDNGETLENSRASMNPRLSYEQYQSKDALDGWQVHAEYHTKFFLLKQTNRYCWTMHPFTMHLV